ncbi:MAG: RidA family protein [Promethearchaeota archaeon]|nr:MAG: RidA family protein [Candidatus Lokiarchaeota archaeon]
MVDIDYVNPGTPVAGPYTPGVKVGDFLFVSGQGPAAGTDTIKDQTWTVLENIKKVVETAGAKVSNIVKTTVFLSDIKNFGKMNRTYQKFFDENGATGKYPARTTVQVANLPAAGMLVEIEAIVVI